jgi:hypothetical protein
MARWKAKPEIKLEDFMDKDNTSYNPLKNRLQIRVSSYSKNLYLKQGNSFIKTDDAEYEADQYVKVFTEHPYTREILMRLKSITSIKLYEFIIHTIIQGNDWLWVNREMFVEETGIKDNKCIDRAIKELCRENIIYIHPDYVGKDVFWINPDIFYCGNRIKKFKECTFEGKNE